MFVILDIVLFTLHTFVLCVKDLSVIIRVSSHHHRGIHGLCYGTFQTSIYQEASYQIQRQSQFSADLLDDKNLCTIASEDYSIIGFTKFK